MNSILRILPTQNYALLNLEYGCDVVDTYCIIMWSILTDCVWEFWALNEGCILNIVIEIEIVYRSNIFIMLFYRWSHLLFQAAPGKPRAGNVIWVVQG